MASVGHIAVGLAGARLWEGTRGRPVNGAAAAFIALSLLPDADVISFSLGIPYAAPFGHRGATHSLAFALALGALAALVARARGWPALRAALLVTSVVASHGLLDTLTDGGHGVALLWPFSDTRFFAPWNPIPVAPIGRGMFSPRGAYVVALETLYFAPLLAWGAWPALRRR